MMLSSQCRMKANLAQHSAGEVALQRNCTRTEGEKNKAAVGWITTRSHVQDKGTRRCMRSGIKYPFYTSDLTASLKSPDCACVLTQFSSFKHNTDLSCFSSSASDVSCCQFCPFFPTAFLQTFNLFPMKPFFIFQLSLMFPWKDFI